jgi:LacI family transcriptional regulator
MKKQRTQTELAAVAGVSQNTVSLALRGDPRLPEATRQRIRQLAEKLGYRTNPLVAALMAQVRRRRPGYQSTIAFVIDGVRKGDLPRHPSLGRALRGARDRAQDRGHRLQDFWLDPRHLTARRLDAMLKSRGITGVIVNPDEGGQTLPELGWDRLATAVLAHLDRRFKQFHCASAPPFRHVGLAVAELRPRGFKRIGLALPRRYDLMMDGLYSAAYVSLRSGQIPPLVSDRWEREDFLRWYRRHQPEAILVRSAEPAVWLQEAGIAVPGKVSLVHLGWHPALKGWAGVDNRAAAMGAAAADLVIEQLNANETGVPEQPKMVLVDGAWVEGGTLVRRSEVPARGRPPHL